MPHQPKENQETKLKRAREALSRAVNLSLDDAIALVAKMQKQPNQLNIEDKKTLTLIFEHALGNNDFNLLLQDSYKDKLSLPEVKTLIDFSYNTRHIEGFASATKKLLDIDPENPSDDHKFTLSEFALVSNLAKIQPIAEQLDKYLDINEAPKLFPILQASQQAKVIENITHEGLKQIGPGAIVLDDSFTKNKVLNRVWDFFKKIRNKFCRYEHSSMLHFTNAGVKRFHLDPEFGKEHFDLKKQLYAEIYEIDTSKLLRKGITASQIPDLKELYREATNEIHTRSFTQLAANSMTPQYAAGAADVIPFGHKMLRTNDFEKIHKQLTGKETLGNNQSMLCSEFCAMTIAATIIELNAKIKEKYSIENAVEMPFGKHEDLHKMHPARLREVLSKKKCLIKAEPPSAKFLISQPKQGKSRAK